MNCDNDNESNIYRNDNYNDYTNSNNSIINYDNANDYDKNG